MTEPSRRGPKIGENWRLYNEEVMSYTCLATNFLHEMSFVFRRDDGRYYTMTKDEFFACENRRLINNEYQEIIDLRDCYKRMIELEEGIRKHMEAQQHEACWLNDQELYRLITPHPIAKKLPPRCEFLSECEKYYDAQTKEV